MDFKELVVPSDKGILDGAGQSMAHMERTGDIRRRFRDDKVAFSLDLVVRPKLGDEKSFFFPPCVPSRLHDRRVVGFVDWVIQGFEDWRVLALTASPQRTADQPTFLLARWCLLDILRKRLIFRCLLRFPLLVLGRRIGTA